MLSPQHEQRRLNHKINLVKTRLEKHRNIRLTLGLGLFIFMAVIAANKPSVILSALFILVFCIFIYFINSSKKILKFYNRLQNLANFCARQVARQEGRPTGRGGLKISELPEKHQVLCQDLHLFGDHSLYDLIDETITDGGRHELARWIYEPLESSEKIEARQKLVRSLSGKVSSLKKLITLKTSEFQIAAKPLEAELQVPLVDEKFSLFYKLHLLLQPSMWGAFVYLLLTGAAPIWLPFLVYFFFFIFSKKCILHNFKKAEEYGYQLDRLSTILHFLENEFDEQKSLLKDLKDHSPSRQIKKLQGVTSALSVQAHPMAYLFMNTILPWEFFWTGVLVKWRKNFLSSYPLWTKELYEFEALASIALFAHYQTQTWPHFSTTRALKFEELYHPLIDRKDVVANSFSVPEKDQLVLITGSNMSGKSTFLRTIGINHSLALMGAPVCASKYECSYMKLFSCLQVTDNLEGGISTFYYEVKAIKGLIERARNGEALLYLVDEIFRGTNNRERYQGAKAIIEELVKHSSVMGFISTHDLELASMDEQLSNMSNWHFRDLVESNRLQFSYKIQSGPCPSTNALKIMRSEGLPVN